jgi:cadmium resistance transport/sequestration family protein
MDIFLGAATSASAAFFATNLDDIIILTLFFAQVNAHFRKRHIIVGQYLGFTIIILASLPGYFGGLIIQRPIIGLLGFMPIIIGIYKLIKRNDNDDEIQAVTGNFDSKKNFFSNILTPQTYNVAAVTFANGGDNISIYVPLFASSNWVRLLITISVFYILAGVWCALGYYFTRHRAVTDIFNKYGNILAPLVLIGLGIYILLDSGTLTLLNIGLTQKLSQTLLPLWSLCLCGQSCVSHIN